MPDLHKQPQAPGYLGAYNWKAPLVGFAAMTVANVAATQYVAHSFHNDPALGQPAARIAGVLIYQPLQWIVWIFKFWHFDTPAVRNPLSVGMSIAILGSVLGVLLALIMNVFRNRTLHNDTEDLHGSARFANESDVRATGMLDSQDGVYVGGWTNERKGLLQYLKHDGPEHILAFAPTRSGKGVSLVIPTLLTWHESAIIYDIKGENWHLTSGFRAHAGHVCWKFAPIEESGIRFNPLEEIRVFTNRDVSDAQNLAQALTYIAKEAGVTENDYWLDSACSLLTGLILHVCYAAKREYRVATFADLRRALNPILKADETDEAARSIEENQLRYRDHLTLIRDWNHDPDTRLKWRDPDGNVTSNHPAVAENIQKMLNRPDREFGSVQGTASKALNLYADPLVSRSIETSDFHIDDLVNFEQPVSLYLVVPPSDQLRLKPLVTLMFTMIVNRLTEKSITSKQSRNKHRLLFMIDEFPTLGNMKIFASAMPTMAGYGLKAYLIAQDVRQIVEAYGEQESIISNCHVRCAFTPNNHETAELLSDMTGVATVPRAAISYSGTRSRTAMTNVSQAVDYVERPLLTPDEIERLPAAVKQGRGAYQKIVKPGAMLIFVSGHYPILGTQMLYFFDPELLRRVNNFDPPDVIFGIYHENGLGTPGRLQKQRCDGLFPPESGSSPVGPSVTLEAKHNALAALASDPPKLEVVPKYKSAEPVVDDANEL